MSSKISRLSPSTGARKSPVRVAWQGSWCDSPDHSNTTLLRSWLVYDRLWDDGDPRISINWNAVLGLLLVTGISAGFWIGVGLLVAQTWK